MIKQGKRLGCLLNEVNGETLADIGTDHGKLVVGAVVSGRVKKAFAVDISEFCLKKAQELAEENGVAENIKFFAGDGFLPLTEKVDVAVIAGMGGLETIKILKQKDIATKYILSPHQDAVFLREYLKKNSYNVLKDFVIKDGKFYDIIIAEKGKSNYNEAELYLGKNYPISDYYLERLKYRKNRIDNILKNYKEANSYKELSAELSKELEVLNNEIAKYN